uniref:hypothetical protein n=1 Tax=Bangia atropurpurea TaxID=31347 RepID=UPI001FCE09A6|nr:hypothetical protein MW410_mgp18 [Bangia atropurpurea]UNJ18838.1 hypothetical protein [Bangia atropurpurea]
MRSRILHYKKTIFSYDSLTQFEIKSFDTIPEFKLCEIQINKTLVNEAKHVCSNLAVIQLIGNSYSIFPSFHSANNLKLIIKNEAKYFLLESIFLLAYKNNFWKENSFQVNNSQRITIIKCHDFFKLIEYFSQYSNFLRLIEKITNKKSNIRIAYEIKPTQTKILNSYFLKSLGYPF